MPGSLNLQLDGYDLDGFVRQAAAFGNAQYGFVVTPNADHIVRLKDDASFRALYAQARYVLLDSRFVSYWLRITRGMRLPICTGSDLTAALFGHVIQPDDQIVLIGGDEMQAKILREKFGLSGLAQHIPPMGFVSDENAVEACLQFVERHSPFRYCFLAVGSPRQEVLASLLKSRGIARGLALCIGASVNFITGYERRAPNWMQRLGMEWFYRLLQDPSRMANRYLVRGPRVFPAMISAHVELRPAAIGADDKRSG